MVINLLITQLKKGQILLFRNKNLKEKKNDILFIKSSNVRKCLSEIAYAIYKNRPKNIIALTGTNGKSSVADFYFQIMKLNKKKVASIGTLGIKKKIM